MIKVFNKEKHLQQICDMLIADVSGFKSITKPTTSLLQELPTVENPVFVYEENNIVKGFIRCARSNPVLRYWNVSKLYVSKGYRKEGIGGKLLSSVIDYYTLLGYSFVKLWVYENNTKAVDFYKKMGLETAGREDAISDQWPILYMRKYLYNLEAWQDQKKQEL